MRPSAALANADLLLEARSGLVRRADLEACGLRGHEIRRLVREGALIRPSHGWYAVPQASPSLIAAAAHRGALTGPSALTEYRVWRSHDRLLHLRAGRHDAIKKGGSICTHTEPAFPVAIAAALDGITVAFAASFACQPVDELVAIADDLLRNRMVRWDDVVEVCAQAGDKGHTVLRLIDTESDSGLESIVRVRLRQLGYRVRTQYRIPGAGHYDLLVGDCLAMDLDGRAFHDHSDAFDEDCRKDQVAVARGYRVMRPTFRHVIHEWPQMLARIRQVTQRGAHRIPPWGRVD